MSASYPKLIANLILACGILSAVQSSLAEDYFWTERKPAGDVDNWWRRIVLSYDGHKIVAAARDGRIYVSNDAGATWTETRPAGDTSQLWSGVAMSGDGAHLVAGVGAAYGNGLYISHDGGATWTRRFPTGVTDFEWNVSAISSDGQKMMAGKWGGGSELCISTDGGANWFSRKPMGPSGSRPWQSVAISADGVQMYAAQYGGRLYRSLDGGQNWSELIPDGDADHWWNGVACSSDGSKIAATYGHSTGRIFTSSDYGTIWTERKPAGDVTKNWYPVATSGGGRIILAGVDPGRLYVSADYGASWQETMPGGSVDKNWETAVVSENGCRLAAGGAELGNRLYTAAASSDLSYGLVAHYPFDGNANDASGNGNHGTVYGATLTADRLGNAGSAYQFDGSTSSIRMNALPDMTSATFSCWVRAPNLASTRRYVFFEGDGTSGHDYGFALFGNNGSFFQFKDSTEVSLADSLFPIGSWFHFVCTADNSTGMITIWVNGVKVREVMHSVNANTGYHNNLSLGRFYDPRTEPALDGSLDDVRFYNRALAQGEIWELNTGYAPAAVSNVRANQRPGTRLVDIYYDAISQNPVYVTASASTNGTAWTIPFSSLSGDVARNVTPGTNRHIVWDAGADWPDHTTGSMIVRVTGGATSSNSGPFSVNTLGSGTWYIRVWADKNSNASYDAGEEIENAEVYVGSRDSEGNKNGLTGADGKIAVTSSAYQGAVLFARKQIYTRPAVKEGHALVSNLMYRLWLDSDGPRYGETDSGVMYNDPENSLWNGTWQSCRLTASGMATAQAGGTLNLQLRHPVFEWNLMLAFETADTNILNQFHRNMLEASFYLYDVTDGQMKFGSAVFHRGVTRGSTTWRNADIVVTLDNNVKPNSTPRGIYDASDTHMNFGNAREVVITPATEYNGYTIYSRFIVHEFGHYALGFYDEYKSGGGDEAAWITYRNIHPLEVKPWTMPYGFMDNEGDTSEMSSRNDYLPNYADPISPFSVTHQVWEHDIANLFGNDAFPCWQWLEHEFQTSYGGIPIEIIVPQSGSYPNNVTSDRDGPAFMPGPYWLFTRTTWLPRPGGKSVALAAVENTDPVNAPQSMSTLQVVEGSKPVVGAVVVLEQALAHRVVRLGQTDHDGCLSTRDVTAGDEFRVAKRGIQASRTVLPTDVGNLIHIDLDPAKSGKRMHPAGLAGHNATNLGLIISATIGTAPNRECAYEVQTSKALAAPPTVAVHLDDSPGISVTMSNVSPNLYRGSFAVSNTSAGTVEVACNATDGEIASAIDAFSIQSVSSNATGQITSRSGWSDVMIQGGGISANSVAVFYQDYAPPILPTGFDKTSVGPVMFIGLGQEASLIGTNAALNVHYGDDDASGINEESVALYKWNKQLSAWDIVQSTASTEGNLVSAMLDTFGVFALFGDSTNDTTAPAAISDFLAATGTNGWTVTLAWTDTGDDGTNGLATSYDLRFGLNPISDTNLASASPYPLDLMPQSNGTPRSIALSMPDPGVTYYFVLRAKDKVGNLSPLSSCISARSMDCDSDADSLPDSWENTYLLNATNSADAVQDSDNDGLNNLQEHEAGTSPRTWDTDGDGMGDKWEVDNHLNPTSGEDRNADNDNDGLTNYEEYQHFTNPNLSDTDQDGMPDKWEIDHGLNALSTSGDNGADADADGDKLDNLSEFNADTHPQDAGSYLGISGILVSNESIAVQWHGGILATQNMRRSFSLSSNVWEDALTLHPPTPITNVWTSPATNGVMFFKLESSR